jgi:hypothetical protein
MQTPQRVLTRRAVGEGLLSAALSFLGLLCTGAVLVAAARLQVPGLGAGASSLDVFATIVVASLGTVGATGHLGEVEITFLPLGALAVTLVLIARNLSSALDRARPSSHVERRTLVGADFLGFGLLCGVSASVFQVNSGEGLSADPLRAAVLGTGWAMVVSFLVLRRQGGEQRRRRDLREIVARAGTPATMSSLFAALSAGGALAFALTRLGGSLARSAGSVLHFLAIAPNAAVALGALSVGSSVEVGASFTSTEAHLERSASYSLFDWAGGPTPPVAWVLILVPIVAGVVAGWAAGRRADSATRAVGRVWGAAVGCGLALGALCLASSARLAAGALPQKGFGEISPAADSTVLLAALWLGVFGTLGVGAAHLYSHWRSSRAASSGGSES